MITATQVFPCATPTGDYCGVLVNGITFFNVYKALRDSIAHLPIVNWTPASKSVVAGDFNAVHEAWQPEASNKNGESEEIEKWAERHNLSCLITAEPTQRRGNTLDLVWTNISDTVAWVDRSECVTSDHLPIRGQVPITAAIMDTKPPKVRVPRGNLPNFARAIARWVHPPPTLDTLEKVEAYAQELCMQLSNVIQVTGYREATSPTLRAVSAQKLRETISAAKKEHCTQRIEAMTTAADIFKLMRSASPRQAKIPPPFSHEGSLITNPAEQETILRNALLARHQATDNLLPCTTASDNRIPWENDISEEDVRKYTIGRGNTAPGADGVSFELLEACWKTIGPHDTQLSRACMQLGTHPTCFKLAEVVLLPKPNRDPTTVKGWRSIALLSCLGKGLERPLAKRLAHLGVTCDVVGHQQFGALPKRSATDLVSCIVHDVEEASFQGWTVTYADDVEILGFGPTAAESSATAQREVDHLLEWAQKNAVAFDTAKSECEKALRAAQHMSRFNSTCRGAAPKALVRAVDTCIVPITTFGSEVGWPGLSRPTIRRPVTPLITGTYKMIDKAILMGLRAALPVVRTSPNIVLHREGGIPPSKYILEGNRLRLAARLYTQDDQHPLRIRAAICPNDGTKKFKKKNKKSTRPELQMSRLQRAYRELPEAEPAAPLPGPINLAKLGTKDTDLRASKRWIEKMPSSEICAYPDGSSDRHGRSAWAFVLKIGGMTLLRESGIIHGGEVLDAEIVGARKAPDAALRILEAERWRSGGRPQQVNEMIDSQQTRNVILTGNISSSIKDVRAFRSLIQETHLAVQVKWVPGHSGIPRNEEADAAAPAALRGLPDRDTEPETITLDYLHHLMNQKRQALLDIFWDESCPPRYRELDLQMWRRKPPELALPRRLLLELIAARTGHGNFAAHHRRFNNLGATMECPCGEESTPTHFIHCRRHAHHVRRLRRATPTLRQIYQKSPRA
ncbi:hypothetical protein K3495_g197 [Podosphaera aphanis]|nr:hypothetical protein K3495_g197 [Podosphaera aphanis]